MNLIQKENQNLQKKIKIWRNFQDSKLTIKKLQILMKQIYKNFIKFLMKG